MSVIILGERSDIGKALATRYVRDGYKVCLSSAPSPGAVEGWSRFISCVGTMKPIGKFFEVDFEQWADSVRVNTLHQLRWLRRVWPCRDPSAPEIGICFLAGGGVNNAVDNYSAYTASKIFLIKMCELITSEEPSVNAFAVGPGFVHTKMHEETLNSQLAFDDPARVKLQEFMEGDGTSMESVYSSINWCFNQGRGIMGGRNLSTVHDNWGTDGSPDSYVSLSAALSAKPDLFKLRRRS